MTERDNGSTVWLSPDRIAKLDRMVAVLSARVGLKISRSEVFGKAIDDLFLTLCPSDRTEIISAGRQEQES